MRSNGKIKVGAVSYLNTKPLLYGLRATDLGVPVEIIETYPSRLAHLLANREIDLGLVPVAMLPKIEGGQVVSGHCIAAEGEVASVGLFSQVPIAEIETILIDYQSRSSAALLRILMREHWKRTPLFLETQGEDYRKLIMGSTAGLVIGDRAFEQKKTSPFVYDLGTAWKAMTGLPFVFAAWIANRTLPRDFLEAFDNANSIGLQNLESIVNAEGFAGYDLMVYYTRNIRYRLGPLEKQGMELFLKKLAGLS